MERVVAAAAGGFVSAVSAGARACQGVIACAQRLHAQQEHGPDRARAGRRAGRGGGGVLLLRYGEVAAPTPTASHRHLQGLC